MSVVQCIHCPKYFWSYRGTHPPAGYCSIQCWEERRRKKVKTGPPDAPQSVLLRMLEHRRAVHQSDSILASFDCLECDRMEAIYADSLSWHQAAAERAMRADERERRP